MIPLGTIEVVELSAQEKVALEAMMVRNYQILRQVAKQRFGSGRPADIRRLRTLNDLPDVATQAIAELNEMGPKICAQYIRSVLALVSSYYLLVSRKVSGLTEEDFVQEAYLAILDATFVYDGRTRFCTYVYACVKKRLANLEKSEVKSGGVRFHVRKLGRSLTWLLKKGVDFDTAVALLGHQSPSSSKNIEDDEENSVEQSCIDPPIWDELVEEGEEAAEEKSLQLQAIALAPLNFLERGLITASFEGNKRAFYANTINPSTGRHYTRQTMRNVLASARVKIQAVYASLLREAAA